MKKGFTLIELLAVIVILTIIALITIPLIIGVISKVRIGAAESSAYNYIEVVETKSVFNELIGEEEPLSEGSYSVNDLKKMYNIKIKGEYPTRGTIEISSSKNVSSASLCINNFEVFYDGNSALVQADNCDNLSTPANIVYTNGTAIYFNPVTGLTCTADEAISTTGTKTGCMKWYAFNDSASSDTVNLILDHNTTALIAWNEDRLEACNGTSGIGPIEILEQIQIDTNLWLGVPTRTDSYSVNSGINNYTINYSGYKARLITAGELAIISGNSIFNEETDLAAQTWFYFDSNTQIQMSTSIGTSNYSWLFDYTKGCTAYGCNIEDNSTWGYWTSTAEYHENCSTDAWIAYRSGFVSSGLINHPEYFGLRPVITILKSSL